MPAADSTEVAATLASLAGEAFASFETRTRDDGSTYITIREGSEVWIADMVQAAHGDFLPDDWRYGSIRSALEALGEGADTDDAHEWADGNVDVYTGALIAWLASHGSRAGYCDEAVEEFGPARKGIVHSIMLGQYAESLEVWHSVVSSLRARVES